MRLIDAKPIEQALFKLADKSLAKNPYANAKICAFRRAFELVLNAPTIAPPPNDPLTLDELREMDGEPVWVEYREKRGYGIVWCNSQYGISVSGGKTVSGFFAALDYGKVWTAYRRKPEVTAP